MGSCSPHAVWTGPCLVVAARLSSGAAGGGAAAGFSPSHGTPWSSSRSAVSKGPPTVSPPRPARRYTSPPQADRATRAAPGPSARPSPECISEARTCTGVERARPLIDERKQRSPPSPPIGSAEGRPLPFPEGEVLDLSVSDLAYGGAGVGRAQGLAIFVSGALPGDLARVRIRSRKAS